MIWFNVPPRVEREAEYLYQVIAEGQQLSGDGPFTAKCHDWIEKRFNAPKALLTTSGSSALDMSAILCELKPGDEVILPSFTFSSTATAFQAQGAQLVFVDVRPDTMNLDEAKIEAAITERTRAIVPVHYAGVACEMDAIMDIARDHGLFVVEDAAQGVMSTYKGKSLGTIGDFGCYSFHETKNYSMGEGGALIVKDPELAERAEIIREKGTNRARFFRGQVDKYTWVDRGSSYLPSDLNAALLWAQLEEADTINDNRLGSWRAYYEAFKPLADAGRVELPHVPAHCTHNGHLFYLKCRDLEDRTAFINHMKAADIMCCFHYVPLHSAPAGLKFGRFNGVDEFTTSESERLVRLPLYYGLAPADVERIVEAAFDYFEHR